MRTYSSTTFSTRTLTVCERLEVQKYCTFTIFLNLQGVYLIERLIYCKRLITLAFSKTPLLKGLLNDQVQCMNFLLPVATQQRSGLATSRGIRLCCTI